MKSGFTRATSSAASAALTVTVRQRYCGVISDIVRTVAWRSIASNGLMRVSRSATVINGRLS